MDRHCLARLELDDPGSKKFEIYSELLIDKVEELFKKNIENKNRR